MYYSSTASASPTAANLIAGELAINTNDGRLFYKDSAGVVQVLATKASASGSFTNLAYTGTLTGGTGVVNLGSGQFYKDASGNIGIGGTNPQAKLDVLTTSGANGISLAGWTFLNWDNSTQLNFGGVTAGSGWQTLKFFTGVAERMRIDSSGNVMVGATSPNNNAKFTVQTSGGAVPAITVYSPSTTNGAQIYLSDNNYSAYLTTVPSGGATSLAFGVSGAERMRIDSSGSLLVGGSSNPGSSKLLVNSGGLGGQCISVGEGSVDGATYGIIQVTRPATNDNKFAYSVVRNGLAIAGIGFATTSNTFVVVNGGNNADNGMTLAQGGTSWGTQSDIRKKNILGNIESGIEKVSKLRTVYFEYKNDDKKVKRVGFIAQDVQAVLPEAVHVEDNEEQTLNVQYSDMIPLLAKAIQELNAKITALESK
jgi:hypothetical protein